MLASLVKAIRMPDTASATSMPGRLVRRVRESGLAHTATLIFGLCVPETILKFQKMSIFETRLSGIDEDGPAIPNLRWATPEDRTLLKQAGFTDDTLDARFRSFGRALLYEEDNALIAVGWYEPYARARWEEYQVTLDLPKNGLWTFDTWVRPDQRGKGLFGKMKAFAHATLRREGYDYVHNMILDTNRNSIRAYQKLGTRKIGGFLFIRFLNFAFFRTEGSWRLCRFRADRMFPVTLHRHDA